MDKNLSCVTVSQEIITGGISKNINRLTLLSSMDQMVAIQLCLAEKNKEVSVCYTPENFCKWIRLGLWCLILLSKSDSPSQKDQMLIPVPPGIKVKVS
jgi:hypothetical protein